MSDTRTAIEAEHDKWLAEDISWLRSLRADYANLVDAISPLDERRDMDEVMGAFVSSWDEEAHQEALQRTERAINELEKRFPFDPCA